MTRPAIILSPLEVLMRGAEKAAPMIIHLYHPSFHGTAPADHLPALLPRSSILALRAGSHTTKGWVDENCPDLLRRLQVTCPLPNSALQWDSPLRRLSHDCEHLTIKVLPSSTPIFDGTVLNPTPAGQVFNIVYDFSSLRVVLPPANAFEPLLSLRLALESTSLRNLTAIHIEPLDISSLLAIRWGSFDSFTDSSWVGQNFWRGLKSLRIGMKSDWLEYAHKNVENEQDVEVKVRLKHERNFYRQGIQMLHNFLMHFSLQDTLEVLRFDWAEGDRSGPNPLLLDEEVAKEEGGQWFSAPGLMWKGLREVWLGHVGIKATDITLSKPRLEGLEKMMVWEDSAAAEISGKLEVIDGREWIDVDLNSEMRNPSEDEAEDLFSAEDGGMCDRSSSMVVPFVLVVDE